MLALFGLIWGVVFGSFANVIIIRSPEGKSVISPSSHCPHCGQFLRWYHNIPILSFLILQGRCAFCKHPISFWYIIVEIVSGLVSMGVFLKLGWSIEALSISSVFILLIALSVIDTRLLAVPESILFWGCVIVFISHDVISVFYEACKAAGAMALLRFGSSYILQKEAMGEGDIYIAAISGALVGFTMSLTVVFIAASLALIPGIFLRIKGRHELPFIPFLTMAIMIVYFGKGVIF